MIRVADDSAEIELEDIESIGNVVSESEVNIPMQEIPTVAKRAVSFHCKILSAIYIDNLS